MLNRNGKEIPEENIPLYLKRRDKTVNRIISRAVKLQAQMEKQKAFIFNEAQKYVKYLNRQSETKMKTTDGNLTLSNFSNTAAVDIMVSDMITFDEKLIQAKTLIDSCLRKWTKRGNANVRSIIDEAFNVDKKGRINTYMVLRLTKLKMNDKVWNQAMQLITDAMQVSSTRQYISLRTRANKDADWQTINLNFSSLKNRQA